MSATQSLERTPSYMSGQMRTRNIVLKAAPKSDWVCGHNKNVVVIRRKARCSRICVSVAIVVNEKVKETRPLPRLLCVNDTTTLFRSKVRLVAR